MRIAFKLDLVALSCLQLALVLGATMDVASASAVAGRRGGHEGAEHQHPDGSTEGPARGAGRGISTRMISNKGLLKVPVAPDPTSPVVLETCDGADPRQQWDVLTKSRHGRNQTQLVLTSDNTLAMACTSGYSNGGNVGQCHQWDSGDTSSSAGTMFMLNKSSSFPAGAFMVEAPSYDSLSTLAAAGAGAGAGAVHDVGASAGPDSPAHPWHAVQLGWAHHDAHGTPIASRMTPRAKASGGSCKQIGCDTPYSPRLPCQCFHGCEKYSVCCEDYEASCPQPAPHVLAPAHATPKHGGPGGPVAVVLTSLPNTTKGSALFTHAGDGQPIVHSASQLCLAQAQSPKRARYNLTMFHVNQGSFSGITNMDLADVGGDALFDFRIPSQRWACTRQGGKSRYPSQCDNPEEFAPDTQLVVTKVVVEVLAGAVGAYSRCNLCPLSGDVPFSPGASACPPGGTCSCAPGSYACWPNTKEGWYGPVGSLQPATAFYVRHHSPNPAPNPYDADTSGRWESNLANRTGGLWYSTLEEGEGKDWRLAETVKKVNATCMSTHWSKQIEKNAASCFQACPQPTNSTSLCYIECFFEGLLGPDGGRVTPARGGLSGEEIRALWLGAFDACPALSASALAPRTPLPIGDTVVPNSQ